MKKSQMRFVTIVDCGLVIVDLKPANPLPIFLFFVRENHGTRP
jgi:hypothetical protein